ncbi:TlpA family protein disulfide reductase [Flavobacterium sp. J372]|uniref:TlpA family protein disulfide reductase n=1 Tax=Flavobacterium sp. J372 TaxID=2898436 RepID=UPI0021511A02|nr:TlpA disulfide reductase family protein [Flavobacterium sp. J372]MCR5861887.1 TlpA family protein disulfide reductase [Flavobacterium sp. J372]
MYISLLLIYGLWFFTIAGTFLAAIFIYTNELFLGTPLLVVSIIAIFTAILKHKSTLSFKKTAVVFTLMIGILAYLLPNYYVYIRNKPNDVISKPVPELTLYDEAGKSFNLRDKAGKIIVLDLWNSSCGSCIKAFPKFEALAHEFKNDTTIEFYSLNIPIRKVDEKDRVKKFTDKYSFSKLYADMNASKALNITAVPQYLIVDKNQNIAYIGGLYTEPNVFYNNFYKLINDIHEK